MRLEAAEVRSLPLAACLCDPGGAPIAASPEWAGRGPGTLSYETGHGALLVAADAAAPGLETATVLLLAEIRTAAARAMLDPAARTRLSMLAAALDLVAGRPPIGTGSASDVVQMAVTALAARAPTLRVLAEPVRPAPVRAPEVVALAVVQLAVNAHRHARAAAVTLRVAAGPTFYAEWPAAPRAGTVVHSHRHALRRDAWGWGYVRMVADALGGAAMPPGPTLPGRQGASIGLGSTRLNLPLAVVEDGRVTRSTLAWDQDPAMPGFGATATPVDDLVAAARAVPGQIAYLDLYRARFDGGRTWLALGPEHGTARARDLLHGLQHERDLWTAPEPQATRAMALSLLLSARLGDPLPSVPPSVWREGFGPACAALGAGLVEVPAAVVNPDPRLAALLLAEAGGALVVEASEIRLRPAFPAHPLLAGLGLAEGGAVRLAG